jgi:carbonic anhydrase
MMINRFIAIVLLCVLAPVSGAAEEKGAAAAPGRPNVQTRESQAAMTPASALEALEAGNARFVSNTSKRRDWTAKVVATAAGQYPFAAVLGCMDSRAPVEVVFDQGIGDVFTVRVAGNVVNEDELGSLEYAVHVGAKLIVVLGHTSCGAVKGAIDGVELGNLTGLLAKIRPAVAAAGCHDAKDAACVNKVAEHNVALSAKQIREKSPYLAKHLDDGTVKLIGAMYDVATGKVTFFES